MGAPPAVLEDIPLEDIPAISTTPSQLQAILEINRAAYDMLAETYRATTSTRQENTKKWLTDLVPQPTSTRRFTALDIGCADGTHARVLTTQGYTVTGVDFSAPMIAAARALSSDPTLPGAPRLLHGEFLTGRYLDERGEETRLDDSCFDLVLATAFVHLFPPERDEEAVRKVLRHVAPGGTALLSTTAAGTNRRGFEAKTAADGRTAVRWRNHYDYPTFLWLVREAARDEYGERATVRQRVVADPVDGAKLWIDLAVDRPA